MDIFISHDSCAVMCLRGTNIESYRTFSSHTDMREAYKYQFANLDITRGSDTTVYSDGLVYHIIWERCQLGFYNTQEGKTGKIKCNRDKK